MDSDASLVDAYRNGDRSAFETLYARHVRSLFAVTYTRTHHRETAEDIVSQTFLQALSRIASFDASRGSFGGWLHRIARNLTVDHYRRSHPGAPIDDAWDLPDGTDVAADASAASSLSAVRLAMKALSSRQRDIVLLRLWHDLSFAEIAERLDLSEGAAKMAYRRSLEKIRSLLSVLLLLVLSSPFYAAVS